MRLRDQYEDYLREKLEIDIMTQRNPYEVRRINEILEIMVDVLNSKAKTIRISGADKDRFSSRMLGYCKLMTDRE